MEAERPRLAGEDDAATIPFPCTKVQRLLTHGWCRSHFFKRRYPYICSIRARQGGSHLCGATLIGDRLALTAAYCVSPQLAGNHPELWCGGHDLSAASQFDPLQAVKITIHPCYQPRTYLNDVAVLELNATARRARPIPGLARGDVVGGLPGGYPLTTMGWGASG